MNYLDTLYRAFIDYRKNTADDRECASQRKAVAKAEADDNDCIEVKRVVCKIDEDWVDAIEDGLVYVEKALAEERQFIRAKGEIVPIEKVKRVSRDSVEHLSKHTNLITKDTTSGDDLIPEQLYTVERLNDYAVYENRFLYMLLTYLSEFIGMRYTRILDLTNTYEGKAVISKSVKSRQKNIEFTLNLDETRRDDPIMRELNPCKDILERISMLLKTVNHFLSTPLMEEVSKAAKLKPPITKTNVLKMDKHFKGAVALYDFIAAYDKDGYTVETVAKKMRFSEIVADEFSELYALSSFLTYEYGMGIKDMLKKEYEAEEERRKALAEQQHLEQLKRLRRRIEEAKCSPEEYMLLLEKQIRTFEGIYSKLEEAREEIDRLTGENRKLTDTVAELEKNIEDLNAEIARLEQKYLDDMAELKRLHAEEIERINADHAAEIERINEQHAQQIEQILAAHQQELSDLRASYEAQIEHINEQHAAELESVRSSCERQISELNEKHRAEVDALNAEHARIVGEKDGQIAELIEKNDQMRKSHAEQVSALITTHNAKIAEMTEIVAKKEQALVDVKEENRLLVDLKQLSDGRLNSLRHQYGLMTEADDFTTENAFNEIENQYNAFRRFFKGEWKKTKKKIRAELFNAYKSVSPENSKANVDTDTVAPKSQTPISQPQENEAEPEQANGQEVEKTAYAPSPEQLAVLDSAVEAARSGYKKPERKKSARKIAPEQLAMLDNAVQAAKSDLAAIENEGKTEDNGENDA